MSEATTAVAPADLVIPIPDDLDLFDNTMTPRQAIQAAKINHVTGQFEIKVDDDTVKTFDDLKVITIVSKDGRVHWDPKEPPGTGKFICKSTDGRMPDVGGEFPGPCLTCREAKWGGPTGKEKDAKTQKILKPNCDQTLNIMAVNEELDPFLVRASKTSLKDAQAFYTKNFINPRRPWFARYVVIGLKQETYGTKPYYVLTFTLAEAVPEELQQEALELFKQSRVVFEALAAQAVYEDSDVGHPEDDGSSPAPAAAAAVSSGGAVPPPPSQWGVYQEPAGQQTLTVPTQPAAPAPAAPTPDPTQESPAAPTAPTAPAVPGPPPGVVAAEAQVGSVTGEALATAKKPSTAGKSRSLFKK